MAGTTSVTTSRHGLALRVESRLERCQEIHFARDVLGTDNPLVAECLGGRDALVVFSPSIDRFYGRRIRTYFAAQRPDASTEFMVLARTEESKTIDAALSVAERACTAGLSRTSPIVAIGGGVCSDICGVAAALYRRGTPHVNIPTTLIGLVDAGIGTKNAVNHAGRKSCLGSFHPPEHVILDGGFLATLPRRSIAGGFAEIIKLATVSDRALFDVLTDHAATALRSKFREPEWAASKMIDMAVRGMIDQLAENLFEIRDYRRKVDFGHTFSPYFETASHHTLSHGEAVAIDIALSAEIAARVGLVTGHELEAILSLIEAVGLALVWPGTSVCDLWRSLQSIVEHRNGDLHLVVPSSIGNCEYLELGALSPQVLDSCLERLAHRPRSHCGRRRAG
jgi:2-epi-5-epi-valiolone synthase